MKFRTAPHPSSQCCQINSNLIRQSPLFNLTQTHPIRCACTRSMNPMNFYAFLLSRSIKNGWKKFYGRNFFLSFYELFLRLLFRVDISCVAYLLLPFLFGAFLGLLSHPEVKSANKKTGTETSHILLP